MLLASDPDREKSKLDVLNAHQPLFPPALCHDPDFKANQYRKKLIAQQLMGPLFRNFFSPAKLIDPGLQRSNKVRRDRIANCLFLHRPIQEKERVEKNLGFIALRETPICASQTYY